MKIKCLILIYIVKIINAKINISIKAGLNASDVSVTYSGSDLKVISEHEMNLFKINKPNLIEAVKQRYGRKPTDVYLKSPTPWGDLYKSYKWEQVSRVLLIESARVKSVTKEPVIVMSHDFDNMSNKTVKVNTGISQTVKNTITTSWSKEKQITVSQEIEYDINVVLAKISGTTGFSYTSSWGENEEKSETITIGTNTGVETELKPGQAATAVLTANRGYLEIEVVYRAILRGNAAVNFKKSYKGHHFWGPPIENIMKSGGLQNERTTREIIKVGYYTDASLRVYDKVSGLPL